MDKMGKLVEAQFKAHGELLEEIKKVDSPQSIAILRALNTYCSTVFLVNQARLSAVVENIGK